MPQAFPVRVPLTVLLPTRLPCMPTFRWALLTPILPASSQSSESHRGSLPIPQLLEFLIVGMCLHPPYQSGFFPPSCWVPTHCFSSRVHFTAAERFVLSCCLFAFASFVPCVPIYTMMPWSSRHHFYAFSVLRGGWGDHSSSTWPQEIP